MNSHDRVPICAGNSSYIKIVSNDFKLPSAVKMLGKKLFLINNKILLISREFIQHSDSSKTSVHFPLTILPIYFFLNRWLHFLHYLENSQNFEVYFILADFTFSHHHLLFTPKDSELPHCTNEITIHQW